MELMLIGEKVTCLGTHFVHHHSNAIWLDWCNNATSYHLDSTMKQQTLMNFRGCKVTMETSETKSSVGLFTDAKCWRKLIIDHSNRVLKFEVGTNREYNLPSARLNWNEPSTYFVVAWLNMTTYHIKQEAKDWSLTRTIKLNKTRIPEVY